MQQSRVTSWAKMTCAIWVLAGGACASSSAAPVAAVTTPEEDSGSPEGVSTYTDPKIDGHPVAQCVTGQGWGAFAPGRCDAAAQRVIADQFCAAQAPEATAVDWTLQHGPSGRHAVWMYGHGSPPASGTWSREVTVDRFSEIRCKQ